MRMRKRLFDLATALVGVILLSPALLVLACCVLVIDGPPVFYRQRRTGYRGKPFRIWKFRTMVADAEQHGLLTVGHDRRVTRTGRWLRQCKLDELPQLFNVIMGEMSLVGPRPEVPHYTDRYTAEQRRVLNLMPGITDPASVRYRDENALFDNTDDPEWVYLNQIMPTKICLNLDYADRATLCRDVLVIFNTLIHLFQRTPEGANSRSK